MNYTPKEVAKIACVHKHTVMNWINGKNKKNKKLIAYKQGGGWKITKNDLIDFLVSQTVGKNKKQRIREHIENTIKGGENGN